MNIRKWLFLTVFALVSTLVWAGFVPVSITLQNKCTRQVKYEVKGGTTTSGTIDGGGKQKLSLEPGQKIYVDGELCVEVSASDNGSTYIVCR